MPEGFWEGVFVGSMAASYVQWLFLKHVCKVRAPKGSFHPIWRGFDN